MLAAAGEKAQADGGYPGERNTIIMPNEHDTQQMRILKKEVRSRHERVNKCLKQFQVLQQHFRHPVEKHFQSFEASS